MARTKAAYALFSLQRKRVIYNIAHENLRVIDLIEIFKRITPTVRTKFLETTDTDTRNYRVSTKRMQKAGFQPKIGVELGAEETVDALVLQPKT